MHEQSRRVGAFMQESVCSEWRGTQDKQPGWDAGELSHARTGHALHLKAREQQQQTERMAG